MPLVEQASAAVEWATRRGRPVEVSREVREVWPRLYAELSQGDAGKAGAITDRAPAQVRRLALTYAVMDRSAVVKAAHMKAALEVWRYCHDSAAYLFAEVPTTPIEARILKVIGKGEGDWVRLSVITKAARPGALLPDSRRPRALV
jgi:DNA replicative helicase MCM subunit Mcm2 (Cdc46/Mcm family)